MKIKLTTPPFLIPEKLPQGPNDSYLEKRFERVIKDFRLPEPIRNMKFDKYYFDFAWPIIRVAVEIDGGTYSGGDHVTGTGYQRMCVKSNLAQMKCWSILRADRDMVYDVQFVYQVRSLIRMRISWLKSGKLPF